MKSQAAFTIVELMVTVAVVAILLAMAGPSMEYMLVSNRISSKTSDFVRALHYARTEAVTRNVTVTITPRENPDGNSGWSSGWEVCCNSSGRPQIKEYEDEVRFSNSRQVSQIQFNAKGGVPQALSSLEFQVCSKKNPNIDGRIITINPTGSIRVQRRRISCS